MTWAGIRMACSRAQQALCEHNIETKTIVGIVPMGAGMESHDEGKHFRVPNNAACRKQYQNKQ
jgi:hypothetical protein